MTYVNTLIQEFHRYAASRLGTYHVQYQNQKPQNQANQIVLGLRAYELANHLGNVLVVISDKKLADEEAHVVSASDYYPFGMTIQERTFQNKEYRFGFNGMEKNPELEGSYTTLYRQLDVRTARWKSIDPKSNLLPYLSPYNSNLNNPIYYNDPKGDLPPMAWGAIIGGGLAVVDLVMESGWKGATTRLYEGDTKAWTKVATGVVTGVALGGVFGILEKGAKTAGVAISSMNRIQRAGMITTNAVASGLIALGGNIADQHLQNGEVTNDNNALYYAFGAGFTGGLLGGFVAFSNKIMSLRVAKSIQQSPYSNSRNGALNPAQGTAFETIANYVFGFTERFFNKSLNNKTRPIILGQEVPTQYIEKAVNRFRYVDYGTYYDEETNTMHFNIFHYKYKTYTDPKTDKVYEKMLGDKTRQYEFELKGIGTPQEIRQYINYLKRNNIIPDRLEDALKNEQNK